MYNMTVNTDGLNLVRVNKAKARNIYNKNKKVYLLPCKVRPTNFFMTVKTSFIQLENAHKNSYEHFLMSFDEKVNAFEYYNCCESLGKYCSYFIEV